MRSSLLVRQASRAVVQSLAPRAVVAAQRPLSSVVRAVPARSAFSRFQINSAVRAFSVHVESVPTLGDSITDGRVIQWNKAPGDFVAQDDILCTVETDKVAVDIRASASGKLVEQLAAEGDTVKVGAELAKIDTAAKGEAKSAAPAAEPKKEAAPAKAAAAPSTSSPAPASAAPAAAPAAKKEAAQPKKEAAPAPKPVVVKSGERVERRVPASRMRQTIARRLKDSQNTAAMLTTFNEIDMTNIMALRNKYKDDFAARHGAKLGFMSAFVKASANALMRSPDVNAFFNDKGSNSEIVYRDFVDISVAVATPTGLVVPVLRNCENMSFQDVELTIAALGEKARKGGITIEDMTGGTFTISNGGVYGSLMGTPILNPPQSAILGMHGIFKRPVAIGDKVEIRPMMYVALTYDHRMIDGATAVKFLKDVKAQVEDPSRMLLDL